MNAGQWCFEVAGAEGDAFSCFPVWMLAVQSISAKHAVSDWVATQSGINDGGLRGDLVEARENIADLRRSDIILGQGRDVLRQIL